MNGGLLQILEQQAPKFSKGQRMIAKYITEQYDKAAFMTAAKLGEKVGVSESTVVRFATELGYDGYPQLQRAMQEMIRSKLTTLQRMEVTSSRIGTDDMISGVLTQDIENIRHTIEEISREDFQRTVEAIANARRIYVIGVRSARVLAVFLTYYLNMMLDNVIQVDTSSETAIFEQMLRIDERDVIIGISFPRYSKRAVRALRFAGDRGARVIAVTDSRESPLAERADDVLLARSDMVSFVDSLVAPLSLLNAMVVGVSLCKKEEVGETFASLERLWEEYQVYEKQ